MTDILIRDVPDDVVAALDERASRLGLSRNEYLRRRFAQDASTTASTVTVEHLNQFAQTFADLADAEVIRAAWT